MNPTPGLETQPVPNPANLNQPPDLTDPKTLIGQCDEIARGLDQQSAAARSGNAMSGHPYPAFFFGKAAEVLRAAAAYVKRAIPAPETSVPAPDAVKTEKPAAKPK